MDDEIDREALADHLIWAEGFRNFPYEDTTGHTTVGCGRNLDDKGLSDDEVLLLLRNDMDSAIADARSLPYWGQLSPARRLVVTDLCFNLGLPRFLGFIRTNEALSCRDWDRAADEMVDSKWYRQTGRRARKLVEVMRTGIWK